MLPDAVESHICCCCESLFHVALLSRPPLRAGVCFDKCGDKYPPLLPLLQTVGDMRRWLNLESRYIPGCLGNGSLPELVES